MTNRDVSAFSQTKGIEAEALRSLLPLLKSWCVDGQLVLFKGASRIYDTEQFGDAGGIVGDDERFATFEMKAEVANPHGNFFLETWSNRTTRRLGWAITSKADVLLYQFITEELVYVMDMKRLQNWLVGQDGEPGMLRGLREIRQAKYQQRNDTWGVLAPIDLVMAAAGIHETPFSTAKGGHGESHAT